MEQNPEEQNRLARAKAMKLLEFSDKTEQQLRDRLKEGEFPPSAIDNAIAYLKDLHYLDDVRYACSYIRVKSGQKSISEMRLQLLQKGVSKEDIDTAMDTETPDESAAVRRLFERKYQHADLTDPEVYKKAFSYFGRKGFSYECIKNTLSDLLENS